MEGIKIGNNRGGVGSVAVNLFDDRVAGTDSPTLKKNHMEVLVKPSSRTRELHKARNDIDMYKESKWTAESVKAEAESELSIAKETVKNLSSMIEESRNKVKVQMRDIETLEKREKSQNGALFARKNENSEHEQTVRELEHVQKDLFKLKLDVSAALEEKSRAEKVIEASKSKMLHYSKTAEILTKEIEEANEEQVLAELARIEALKEWADIKSQKEKEANYYAVKLESMRKRLNNAFEEIDESKELEKKLAVTMSDVEFLQNELNSVKEMAKSVQRDSSMERFEGKFRKEEESGDSTVSQNVKEELEAAKKKLTMTRVECFRLMASMDVIRNELKRFTSETTRLKKEEGKVESTLQNINSKLLRAKSKLEAVSGVEKKTKSIVISLSHTLDNLKAEIDAAKKEKETISQEITTAKDEIEKTESEIDMTEERLRGAMEDLEVAKTSEALALEKLRTLAETTMTERGVAAEHSSMITISRFEYEYLTNHAAAAEEIAAKKVEAAEAWIEAFKASENEILMKTKIAERELKETEKEIHTKDKFLSRKDSSEEFDYCPRKRERNSSKNFQRAMSRKSIKSNGSITPSRRAKFQKSASPAAARRVSPFPIKKKKKVIANFKKFFRGKKNSMTT